MRCPYCLNGKTRVIDKRDVNELIRRRRECETCGKRFTTYERLEISNLTVVKKDGRRERFDREKLVKGVLKACEKRPISRETVEKLAQGIEMDLRHYEKEVKATMIGELVMEKLSKIDKVAYIRFASVYREFKDISSFEKELQKIKRG